MTDFSKILNKAKELEAKMKESQEKIRNIEVEGTSGTNSVKVKLNGDGEMISLEISPEVMKEDVSILEDLIKASHQNAVINLQAKKNEAIKEATGSFGMPSGFKWPMT